MNVNAGTGVESATPTVRTAEGVADTVSDVMPEKIPCASKPHQLPADKRAILDQTIESFPYTPKTGPLNKTPIYTQYICTGDAIPEMRKQYPLSPYVLEEVNAEVKKLVERDIIEPIESSPWRWPILWVKKKMGGGRICLDARGLNKVAVPDAYPTLNVDSILRNLPKAKYITCLDMTQAFHQIEIAPEDRKKTAFAVGAHFYCYKRAVMGFRNSPADLSKMLDKVFHDMTPQVYHYVDDFVILSQTFEEHIELLAEVARRLRANNLTISREKSSFCHKQITFLGYLLTEEGLTIDPSRVQPIMNYKKPENVKQLRRLVGLITWYRRFIPNAAELMKPLTDLIEKDNHRKIDWTSEAEEAFGRLKQCLMEAPILAPADYTKPFKVYTDASLVAGAAILTQMHGDQEKVVAYHSVKFSRTQQNYSATERECLAVLSAVEKFRPWIDGVKFTVVTDHSSLRWLQNLKEPHGNLARWAVRLQAFDIEFEHRPGKQMAAPDALSRAIDIIVINKDATTNDKWYQKIRQLAKDGRVDRYKYENGYVYRRGKYDTHAGDRLWTMCVPRELVAEVLREKHDLASHMGFWKTLKAIQSSYYWQDMHKDIYQYVTQCEVCRTCKQTNERTQAEGGRYRDPGQPGRMLSIDIIGPLPPSKGKRHQFAVICIDVFSRYAFARSFSRATAENICEFLERDVLYHFHAPEVLISDNGQQFKSKTFQQLLQKYRIHHHRTPNYHAQANPVEATNKTIKSSLRANIEAGQHLHTEWAEMLPRIIMNMNTTPHTSTGKSPYYVLFGREKIHTGDEYKIILDVNPDQTFVPDRTEVIWEEAAEEARGTFEENRKRYNTRAALRKFNVGDQVRYAVRNLSSAADKFAGKLAPIRKNAYIAKIIGNDTYELMDTQQKPIGVYHANDLASR